MKRGDSNYISWIILLAMIVAISFVLYNWSVEQAKRTSEEIETQSDPLVCAEIGFSVDSICQSYNVFKLNVTNTKTLDIEGFLIRTAGLYPEDEDYLNTYTYTYKIQPAERERLTIIKQGTLSQVQIVPIALKANKYVYCEEQTLTKEKQDLIQC